MLLTKDFGLEIKGVAEDGTFEGYASVFGGPPDSYGDVVMPGAFQDSLAAHKRAGTMPSMLWAHRADHIPIGVWTDFAEDGRGLKAVGQIHTDDAEGSRVYRALKTKAVKGLSIGYQTVEEKADDKAPGINKLIKVNLWEVSVVNFPANRRSTVSAVKSAFAAGNLPTVREFQDALREQGFSKGLADKIAASAAPHLRGDPGVADTDDVQRFLKGVLG